MEFAIKLNKVSTIFVTYTPTLNGPPFSQITFTTEKQVNGRSWPSGL
jgi:hypothetical protein